MLVGTIKLKMDKQLENHCVIHLLYPNKTKKSSPIETVIKWTWKLHPISIKMIENECQDPMKKLGYYMYNNGSHFLDHKLLTKKWKEIWPYPIIEKFTADDTVFEESRLPKHSVKHRYPRRIGFSYYNASIDLC